MSEERNPRHQPIRGYKEISFTNKWLKELEKVRLNPYEDLPEPQSVLKINESIIATLGNFSLIIGKAKSRKTFFVTSCIAAFLSTNPTLGSLYGVRNENKTRAILFDTEQGRHHLQQTVNRIVRQRDNKDLDQIEVFGLRKYNALERLNMIEAKLYASPNLGLVVIDGVRDLVTSINNEEQASKITTRLLKWTEELGIHMIVVLHQNKYNDKARGHLGAELVNKAETTLSLTLDKDISVVQAEYCRSIEPNPLAFKINENGLPKLVAEYRISISGRKPFSILDYKPIKLFKLFEALLPNDIELKYGELIELLKHEIEAQLGAKWSQANIKSLITLAKNKEWITQEKIRSPYRLGLFNEG